MSKNHFKKRNNKKLKNQREKNAILLVFQLYKEDTIQPELSSPARFRIQGG